MRNIFSLLLVISLLGVTFASAEICDTNAQLPDDKQIWPIPKVEMGPKTIQLTATFSEQKMVLSYNQGKWRRDIYLVIYKLEKEDKRFPNENIIFMVRDFNPAEGSNIKLKKLAWPFRKGKMTFYLEPDESIDFREFFQIVSYKR